MTKEEKKVKNFIKYFEDQGKSVIVIAETDKDVVTTVSSAPGEFVVYWCTRVIDKMMTRHDHHDKMTKLEENLKKKTETKEKP